VIKTIIRAGYLYAAVLMGLACDVHAQNLGEPCALSAEGKPCSGSGTCLKFTCAASGSASAQGFCDGTPNLCPPGSKYMSACGSAGKCVARQVTFIGSSAGTCNAAVFACAESLVSADGGSSATASPDAGISHGSADSGADQNKTSGSGSCSVSSRAMCQGANSAAAASLALVALSWCIRVRRSRY
jgi:hypothetical protein